MEKPGMMPEGRDVVRGDRPGLTHAPAMNRIGDLVARVRRVLIVTHVAPDGDAIGSLLGFGGLLEPLVEEVTLACEDSVPDTYAWLPGSGRITRSGTGLYDLSFAIDCSDERRMGRLVDETTGGPLVNIDHHVTNTHFGTVNWVDPGAVSTTQMILTLAEYLGWPLNPDVATCLLAGLVTDTQSFRTSNVDEAAIAAALRLMDAGASLSEVSRRTLGQRPLATLRLWGEAMRSLELDGDILWVEVTRAMRERWDLSENGISGLTNLLASARESSVVLVFTERDDGTVDVGMRAVPGYDVAQVALGLGGGGHPQASGCTLAGDLADVRLRVLAEVRSSLARQR